MATINFFTNGVNLNGSGLGFYGSDGFGASVPVGEYQGRTFITDSAGATNIYETNNVKFLSAPSGILGQVGSGVGLPAIPNAQASLNPRFTHTTAVRTQNVKLYIYDRTSISNPPSGVTCKVAQIIHPSISQGPGGSGSSNWHTPAGTSYMSLTSSPGLSGLSPNGPSTTDMTHDYYLAISASPDTIGSKTQFGLYLALEFL